MKKVLYESKNHIAYVTLNRPEVYNAMDQALLYELLEVIKAVEKSDDKVVIIHGAGHAFSAGGDVSMMGTDQMVEGMDEMMNIIAEITLAWFKLDKMVISAIHGTAAGLGLSFALNADVVMAEEETKLGMLFAGVGFVPDGGGHYFLRERLGAHAAKQFIWSMEQVNGRQAKQMGLIDELVEDDVLQAATKIATKAMHLPMDAIMASKKIYTEMHEHELRKIVELEKTSQMALAQGENHREGVRAFLEKRPPRFV